MIREKRRAEAQAVGAAAVNQLVKAVILANEFLLDEGIQIACVPEYVDISEEGKKRSTVKFVIGICSIEDEPADM
jgi:stage V sporulation protein S